MLDFSLAHASTAPGATPNRDATTANLPEATVSAPAPITVQEGSTRHTITVPVTITGKLTQPARLGIAVDATDAPNATISTTDVTWVTVKPGQKTVQLPVTIDGNRVDNDDTFPIGFQLETRGPLAVRDPNGKVTVRDDDPDPTFTVTPVRDTVKPGGTLEWKVTMHGATERSFWSVTAGPAAPSGTELTVDQLTPETREKFGVDGEADGVGSQKFSEASTSSDIAFGEPDSHGNRTATVTVGTTPGDYSGNVRVNLEFVGVTGPDGALTGTVTAGK